MRVIATICVFTSVISMCYAQRGSYAGSRPIINGYKGPYPEESNTLSNRFGDESNSINGYQNVIPLPQNFPFNADHNMYFLNNIDNLPQAQQPFWYLNRDYISNHLNGPQNVGGSVVSNRGSFMGRRRR